MLQTETTPHRASAEGQGEVPVFKISRIWTQSDNHRHCRNFAPKSVPTDWRSQATTPWPVAIAGTNELAGLVLSGTCVDARGERGSRRAGRVRPKNTRN